MPVGGEDSGDFLASPRSRRPDSQVRTGPLEMLNDRGVCGAVVAGAAHSCLCTACCRGDREDAHVPEEGQR